MSGATKLFVDTKLKQRPVIVFSKKASAECLRAKMILSNYELDMPEDFCEYVEIESRQDCGSIENYLMQLSLNDCRQV
jgi:hypothetical protein